MRAQKEKPKTLRWKLLFYLPLDTAPLEISSEAEGVQTWPVYSRSQKKNQKPWQVVTVRRRKPSCNEDTLWIAGLIPNLDSLRVGLLHLPSFYELVFVWFQNISIYLFPTPFGLFYCHPTLWLILWHRKRWQIFMQDDFPIHSCKILQLLLSSLLHPARNVWRHVEWHECVSMMMTMMMRMISMTMTIKRMI